MTLKLSHKAIKRCMQSAARGGLDPYNSHPAQSAKWERAWNDKARRS